MTESKKISEQTNEELGLPNLDPCWTYRVIRRTWDLGGKPEYQYGVYEVNTEKGEVVLWSETPDSAIGESLEGLRESLQWQLEALDAPVLNWEDLDSNGS